MLNNVYGFQAINTNDNTNDHFIDIYVSNNAYLNNVEANNIDVSNETTLNKVYLSGAALNNRYIKAFVANHTWTNGINNNIRITGFVKSGGNLDLTNNSFIVPKSGIYSISLMCATFNSVGISSAIIGIYFIKNVFGFPISLQSFIYNSGFTGYFNGFSFSHVGYFDSGDVLDFFTHIDNELLVITSEFKLEVTMLWNSI